MKYIFIGIVLSIGLLNPYSPLSSSLAEQISEEDIDVESIIEKLTRIGIIHWGSFTLKKGSISSYYMDLRRAVSYPQLLLHMSELMHKKIKNLTFDTLCGVPYGAFAITVGISLRYNLPMIFVRKEEKSYGMAQRIEGIYRDSDTVLIVEDVITSGKSIAKIAQILRSEGLIVTDAIVFLDREEGGKQYLESLGIRVHSIVTVSTLLTSANL